MTMDVEKSPERIEKQPTPGSNSPPVPELIEDTPTPKPMDFPAPELIRDEDESTDGDKQSDLNVPGGKGVIRT